jgi:hypothetical protein
LLLIPAFQLLPCAIDGYAGLLRHGTHLSKSGTLRVTESILCRDPLCSTTCSGQYQVRCIASVSTRLPALTSLAVSFQKEVFQRPSP